MTIQITGNNMNGSPELSLSGGNCNTFAWSPFGVGTGRTTPSLPGFNGERQDPLYGVTHLGNGYRAYSPALRRFTCPDSESPFGVGGINPYVYCEHDPVNRSDPSGHGPVIRKSASLGLRLGVASEETADAMATGVATAGVVETGTELAAQGATGLSQQVAKARGDVEAARELGWASLGTGLSGGLAEGDVQQVVKRWRGESKIRLVGESQIKDDQYQVNKITKMSIEGVTENGESYDFPRGYTDNFRGKGEDAILLHGREDGQVLVGEMLQKETTPDGTIKIIGTDDSNTYWLTGKQLAAVMRDAFGINIYNGNGPVHLVGCYGKLTAQSLADEIKRPVIGYAKKPTITKSLYAIEKPDYTVSVLSGNKTYIARPRVFKPR